MALRIQAHDPERPWRVPRDRLFAHRAPLALSKSGLRRFVEVKPRTAAKYLEHIYRKLVSSRAASAVPVRAAEVAGHAQPDRESLGDALTGPALAGADDQGAK